LESHHPEKIVEAEGKDLLELFEQQAVYLYNPDSSGNNQVKQMAVVPKKGRKRGSIFLFDTPEEDLVPQQPETITGQAPGGRKSRFFLLNEGYPNPLQTTSNQIMMDQKIHDEFRKHHPLQTTEDVDTRRGSNMMITKVDPTNFTEVRNFDAEKYRLVREIMPEKIDKLIAHCEFLRRGQNKKIFMIIDDTMLRRSSRRKYLTMAREYHWGYLEVFVKVEVSEAVKWDASRPANKQVGKRVIEKSLEQLDIVPNKFLLVWDTEDKKLETFEGKIKVPKIETKPDQKNIETFNSVLYDCMDLGARKCIGDILKGSAGPDVQYLVNFKDTLDKMSADKKTYSKRLMDEKKIFYEILKSLVKKIFEQENRLGSVSLYKTCQDMFSTATKKPHMKSLTSVEDFGKFERVAPQMDNFNEEETKMDYEVFMEIVGDLEEALELKDVGGQIPAEVKNSLVGKCNQFYGHWVVERLSK